MTYEELMAGWDKIISDLDAHTEKMKLIRARVSEATENSQILCDEIVAHMTKTNEAYASTMKDN